MLLLWPSVYCRFDLITLLVPDKKKEIKNQRSKKGRERKGMRRERKGRERDREIKK